MSQSCRPKQQRESEPPVHTPGDGWFVVSFLIGVLLLTFLIVRGCL